MPRIMTQEDKNAYLLAHGKMPLSGKMKRLKRNKGSLILNLIIIIPIIIGIAGYIIWGKVKPTRISDIISSEYDTVVWSGDTADVFANGKTFGVDELKAFKVQKAFPPEIDSEHSAKAELKKTNKTGEQEAAGEVYFTKDKYIVCDNVIYKYE